ncbi:hypothetical protein A3D81_00745 [Candidatus Curtissbacteria bacterium RIFCSPHIGHO2_02_FULL_40_17]|uniref:Uncharacterized protein n=4 Tax=Patescibacteria group TaxID=1783273 RepID=A0A1G2HH29_9BACT|nr:MAG: hypothetical protein A3D81_00745 [Candidatus Curtissbacteria bacterium RIFCSPHIGHO2_02_FULL_40_17]OGE03842.1 MAG: hypothetical protein A3F45_01060 [Candidatus Curtissbacteria bacterium RIFCSPHIGHO2_12_FULL_41_17]OGE05919.1 MAG: hypothetical protein A3I53_02235 [Candidatus Curtissbacteria bacterium RIFCSPLOWO2_02_FULL_40_13b]OGZ58925.1 MAG: hypothetical protein A2728_02015 [Candidatus Spechtbacteria bacterium RIFCSPHIGHO2_01_FULL_38_11]OGZ61551.1 MAG: hypothetical protein A3F94_00215 [Ca
MAYGTTWEKIFAIRSNRKFATAKEAFDAASDMKRVLGEAGFVLLKGGDGGSVTTNTALDAKSLFSE